MATDVVQVQTLNFEEVLTAFREAPTLAQRFMKQEMHRATARVRKRFMRERMSGAPGIKGGTWKRQHKRHIKYWTAGTSLASLQSGIRISRFLTLHETGGVITAQHKGRKMLRIPIGKRFRLPTRGGFDGKRIKGLIFIARPGKDPLLAEKKGDQLVPRFVLKHRVVMKARLGFKETVLREWPKEFPKLAEALQRAMRVTLEQRMKASAGFVTRAVA